MGEKSMDPKLPPRSAPRTSERVTVEQYTSSPGAYAIYCMHVATYAYALPHATGRRVLDMGCGTGYGTAELATAATSVVGVDISAEAIEHARTTFSAPGLTFEQIGPVQVSPLPFADGAFDVVTSFQVIEHIDEVDSYLDEIRRVLSPEGVFLCVTPDRRRRLFPGQRPWNEFHCTEYRPDQLAGLLRSRFADVQLSGMTAAPQLLGYELRRYRRMRLLSYPFTFPGVPERWRQAGIHAAKKVLDRTRPAAPVGTTTPSFGFGPEDVVIRPEASPSVNIVAVASGAVPAGH